MLLSYKTVFLDPSFSAEKIEEYKAILESLDAVLATQVDEETDIIVTNEPEKYNEENLGDVYSLVVIDEKEFSASLLMEKLGNSDVELNKDEGLRNSILKPYLINKSGNYSGGALSFRDVPFDVMKKLFCFDFIDPRDTQNNSPTNREFIDFGKKFPFVKYHGYVISAEREDYRLSIEGVNFVVSKKDHKGKKTKLIKDFKKLNNGADELVVSEGEDGSVEFYSWFD